MSQIHVLSRGNRRYSLNDYTNNSIALSASNIALTNWLTRIINSGGVTPSTTTQNAIKQFYIDLYNNNILNKMVNVNCVVPDNLQSAICPFIATAGSGSSGISNSWGNVGFTTGDLSSSGLKGNTTAKRLLTGIIPSQNFTSDSFGITLYNTFSDSSTNADASSYNSSTQAMQLLCDYGGTSYFDCWNETGGTGRISGTTTIGGLGYTSGNRTSNSRSDLYQANSSVSHTSIANSTSTSIGTVPTYELPIFAWNHNGSFAQYTAKRFSFIGIHKGLTSSESQLFFNIIQKLRTNLGGGYI